MDCLAAGNGGIWWAFTRFTSWKLAPQSRFHVFRLEVWGVEPFNFGMPKNSAKTLGCHPLFLTIGWPDFTRNDCRHQQPWVSSPDDMLVSVETIKTSHGCKNQYWLIEWASALVPPTPLFGGSCRERERERERKRESSFVKWRTLR